MISRHIAVNEYSFTYCPDLTRRCQTTTEMLTELRKFCSHGAPILNDRRWPLTSWKEEESLHWTLQRISSTIRSALKCKRPMIRQFWNMKISKLLENKLYPRTDGIGYPRWLSQKRWCTSVWSKLRKTLQSHKMIFLSRPPYERMHQSSLEIYRILQARWILGTARWEYMNETMKTVLRLYH